MRKYVSSLLAGALLVAQTSADAFSVRITPIGVEMLASERAQSVTIANVDTDASSMQVRIFKWTQVSGEDHLEPTNDLVVSPPFLTVPAGKSYTVRVVRTAVRPVAIEASYRLLIDEIPRPIDPRLPQQGVRMVLRTSMPVFVVDKSAMASLTWQVWQDNDGIHAQAQNAGRRHAKIGGLALHRADGSIIRISEGLAGYVLAGSVKRFDLKPAGPVKLPQLTAGEHVGITAKSDALDIQGSAVVESR